MTKLEKLVERLENMGLKIAKHDLKIHILNNLPRAYDVTVKIIKDDVKNYSISKIRSKLSIMSKNVNSVKKCQNVKKFQTSS